MTQYEKNLGFDSIRNFCSDPVAFCDKNRPAAVSMFRKAAGGGKKIAFYMADLSI